MENNTIPINGLIAKLINPILNIIKSSQFVNLVIFGFFYFCIFCVILLGYFFSFYESQTADFIVRFTSYFIDINSNTPTQLYFDGSKLIKYYLLLLFILGVFQEFVLVVIKRISSKDLRGVIEKTRTLLFFIVATVILIIESIVSFITNDWWLTLIGFVSFVILILFYFWYRLVLKIINNVQGKLNIKPETNYIL
jgi:hypothetical protein